MKMEECPKCGDSVEPKWHHGKCPKPDMLANISQKEHLHYFCRCGYDFIKLIKTEKKGIGYDDMGRMVEEDE